MRIITGIQKRGQYLRIYVGKRETSEKSYQYQCMDGRRRTVRQQIEELLGERQRRIPDDQIYIKLCLSDERLCQHDWDSKESITLHLESDDFGDITGENGTFVKISSGETEYIEYGSENGSRYIAANPYYFLRELNNEIKIQLEENGKLIDFMEADENFDYSSPETTQDNPGRRYSSVVQNDYYVLRHAFVYTLVYYRMFRSLLGGLPLDEPIRLHILSIGCGSKTDALGLRQALRHCPTVTAAKYIGMDPGKWNESKYFLYLNGDDEYIQLQEPGSVNRTYAEQEMEYIDSLEYRQALEQFETDGCGQKSIYLVVFPNSISEIPVDDLLNILSSIRSSYNGKKLYICLSRNVNSTGDPIDQAQVNMLKDFFQDCQPVINCERGCEEGDERTEEEIDSERSEVLGIEIDTGKKLYDRIWCKLKISDDVETQMEDPIIGKALEKCLEQEREDKRMYIQNYIEYLRNTQRENGYPLQLLKQPIKDINKFDCYQVYEVPEK